MTIKKAVIPAAGLGTRLLPLTKSQPKEMLPVGRKPTIQYVVEELLGSGLLNILIITGRMKRAIEDHFKRDQSLVDKLIDKPELLKELEYEERDMKLLYVRQSRPMGSADAVLQAEDFVGDESFVVAFGDNIIRSSGAVPLVSRLIDVHRAQGSAATIAVEEVAAERLGYYGVVKPGVRSGEALEVIDIVEKPQVGEAPSNLAIAARYIFESIIFDMIREIEPAADGELQLTAAIKLLIDRGYPVWCVQLSPSDKRYDIGNFENYFKAFFEIALEDPELGKLLKNYLQIVLDSL